MTQAARPLNQWDGVKLLAIVLMLCDHASAYYFRDPEQIYWLRALGRGAAFTFLFLAGLAGSYRFDKKLLGWAVLLSAFQWIYLWKIQTLNILFTIIIARMLFQRQAARARVIARPWEWLAVGVAMVITTILFEYGSLGIMVAMAGYMHRHRAHYSQRTARGVMWGSAGIFMLVQIFFAKIPLQMLVALGAMLIPMLVMLRMTPGMPILVSGPPLLKAGLRFLARHSAEFYVLHLILLTLIFGAPI